MISVIVPVYNVEKYLRECIDSILSQSYPHFELLLIDDGSTDGSGTICDEYASKDKRVKVIHKKNGGLSSARNCGIENASGDWIIFIDSDDLWGSRDCLQLLHDYATHLGLDILRFEYCAVDENLEPIEVPRFDKSMVKNKIISNFEMVRHAVCGEWFAWLYLINRKVLENIRFDENVKFQEDIEFYCRLFAGKNLKCGYIDANLYYYRKRNSSLTTTPKIDNLKGSFGLCQKFYSESEKTQDKDLRDLYQYYSVMMYYWTLGTLSEAPYYAIRKSIIEELSLKELHKETLKRLKTTNIDLKSRIFITPPPHLGSALLKLKNAIVIKLKKLI